MSFLTQQYFDSFVRFTTELLSPSLPQCCKQPATVDYLFSITMKTRILKIISFSWRDYVVVAVVVEGNECVRYRVQSPQSDKARCSWTGHSNMGSEIHLCLR